MARRSGSDLDIVQIQAHGLKAEPELSSRVTGFGTSDSHPYLRMDVQPCIMLLAFRILTK